MQQTTIYNVENVLVIGDFNLVPSRELDRLHASGPPQYGLAHWAAAFHMTDVWRHFHPSDREYTCLSTSYRTMSRIDLAFASSAMVQRVLSVEILSRGISDHAPLAVTIRTSPVEGVRVWRPSGSWIADPEIQEAMPAALCNFWLDNADSGDPGVLWDAFKAWLRGEFITQIARGKRQSVQSLRQKEELAGVREAEFVRTPGQNNYILWQDALRDLSLLRIDLTKKSMLDGAQRVFEFGNKNGRLLAWLARGQHAVTHIGRLKGSDGRPLTRQADIDERFLEFYRDLYSSRVSYTKSDLLRYLDCIQLPALGVDKSEQLDADISLEEVQVALGSMQSGKTPGPDGIPIEFYSTYQELLAPRLTALLKQFMEKESLPESTYDAIVVLVPKPGKDPEECTSYRPISLINADAKLLAKILATRLGTVMDDLVHVDQTGFMAGKGTDIKYPSLIFEPVHIP